MSVLQARDSEMREGESGRQTTAATFRRSYKRMLATCQQHFPFQKCHLIFFFFFFLLATCMRDFLTLGVLFLLLLTVPVGVLVSRPQG